jgi:hypothetical protein
MLDGFHAKVRSDMPTSALMVLLVLEFATGAASAMLLGQLVPPLSMGAWRNAVLGGIGGVVLTWMAGQIPDLEQYVEAAGEPETAALSPELLAGVGVAGFLGGALFVVVFGLLRNRLAA